jgi:hypothetical protein
MEMLLCDLTHIQSYFNVMLRELGVQNVKVMEVYTMEDDFIESLP